ADSHRLTPRARDTDGTARRAALYVGDARGARIRTGDEEIVLGHRLDKGSAGAESTTRPAVRQGFRFPNRPERTPLPLGVVCLPPRISRSRNSSDASECEGSSSSAFRNASADPEGSLIRYRTPAT